MSGGLDGADVKKRFTRTVRQLDEAEALLAVEPLHLCLGLGARRHCPRRSRTCRGGGTRGRPFFLPPTTTLRTAIPTFAHSAPPAAFSTDGECRVRSLWSTGIAMQTCENCDGSVPRWNRTHPRWRQR